MSIEKQMLGQAYELPKILDVDQAKKELRDHLSIVKDKAIDKLQPSKQEAGESREDFEVHAESERSYALDRDADDRWEFRNFWTSRIDDSIRAQVISELGAEGDSEILDHIEKWESEGKQS